MRFLGLELCDDVPDAKTIWLFKENLTKAKVASQLFKIFYRVLDKMNLIAHEGSIIDASFVEVPKQRNNRDENKDIKDGKIPEEWEKDENSHKLSQKDTDARWTQKNKINYYGYKDHVKVDAKSKLITKYEVTDSSVHDSQKLDDLLDEESGELNLRTPFSIFVGGQVLDRGVTIPNMIGFYYGRSPISMQQDTVLQHSRMFGYRDVELLAVTRFYTTERIHSDMEKITEIDMALREDIEKGTLGNGVYFITNKQPENKGDDRNRIVPCSPDKIRISDVILLKPHKRLLPVEFTPISKANSLRIDNELSKKIPKLNSESKMITVEVTLREAEELIELIYSGIGEDEGATRFVSKDEFITTLRYLIGENNELSIVVKKNKNNAKYRKTGRLEDAPETGDRELKIAQDLAIDAPVLLLLQETGENNGWQNRPFWWSILVAPKNISKTIYASKLPTERIKKQ